MGKNRKKGKGAAQAGPKGMRLPAPPQPRPPPQQGGFRGPAPGFQMGPPGHRFPAPHHDFGQQPPRMRMMDDMERDRGFMQEPQGFMVNDGPFNRMDFPDRHECRPRFEGPDPAFRHQEFGNRPPAPALPFYRPELEYEPRFRSPEFCDRPRDFCPPEFRGRPPNFRPPEFDGGPGFHMMNPAFDQMEQFGPRDQHYMPPMDPHGNHSFGERGGFAAPLAPDFRGPGPVQPPSEAFSSAPRPACSPQPPQKKDQLAPKETKTEPPKSMALKISSFKNISANAPRGRSLGVISLVANNCGFIEREDLKKFSFVFDAFFGNRALLLPGVKVHFTAVKNLGKDCAVDVKVAPGGTEDIDSTVYEGVVLTVLPHDNVKEANPGCIRTIISKDPIKLPFGKADTSVTLLLYDRVEFQLLTNVITREQRATNIKPKTPDTFQLTKEVREMGVIINKSDETLTIMTQKHDSLTATSTDNLSDEELNVMDEVELTILTVNDTKKAVRLKKLPEGSVTFNQKAKGNENMSDTNDNTSGTGPVKDKWKPVNTEAGSQDLDVSSEKYEGTITQIVPKKSPSEDKVMDNQECSLGFLVTTVEGTEKRLSFKSGDVITKATMMLGDKVQFNISTNVVTKEECGVNVEILPETFQTDSEEQRKIGLVVKLDDNFGFIKTQQDPQLFFDISEVMEDTKLTLSEKVEFTLVQNEAAEGGKHAVRIRRLNESVFTSAPKLEAFGVKEKKKMTIKLLKDPKDQIKEEVKTEAKVSESVDVDKGKDKPLPYKSSAKDLKKESDSKQESTKGDKVRSRSRENSRRRYSRSRSRESGRRRYSRSRSRSRDRSRSYYRRRRSTSRERRDNRYRFKCSRSRSKERVERSRRSHSRERSSQSTRKRSRSPADKYDHYAKQSGNKDLSDKKKVKSPDDVEEELLRKRRELMELNELIARKKAIVAMEQNAKKIEPEDGKSGVTTFDYEHVHRENIWMPDLKPVKSILKKQSEPHIDPKSQASASKEVAAPFVKSESQEMQIGYHQQAFGSPGYSTFESIAERTLTTSGSDKTTVTLSQDLELVRQKKQLEDLSESVARKKALIALEQKVKVVQEMPEMEAEHKFDSHTEDQFVMTKGNLWSSVIKPDIQPKKSILKKRSEILTSQSDKTSVDEYGQLSQDGDSFTKPPSQKTAALPFNRSSNPQSVQTSMLGLFSQIKNESSADSQRIETPSFNKPVISQSHSQVSSLRSLHEQKSSSMSKGSNSQDDQHRASSHLPHPPSSIPSTSQTSPSDQKRNLTTQMERFLSALNKADTSIVNSLFQEARKDLTLINTQKPTQPQLDRNIPFMDEIYDPFKEDEDNGQPSLIGKQSGQQRLKTETRLNDPGKDDLLPHERAVQDGSGFSQLVGMKYGADPTAKAEKKSLYGHPMVSESWKQNAYKENLNQFSEQWNLYEQDTDMYATEHKHYTNEHSLYRERSQSFECQKVNPSVQHSYVVDREIPDSRFDKSLARQESEESTADKNSKTENFEKIQSLLQTIGLHLDTAEVSKLADRTQERLYGKTKKTQSVPAHSFEQKRERSMSQTDQRGSCSRADSSDSEDYRSVSPAQSSNRKVYMSYKDTVKYKDQHKAEDVDLSSIKRIVVNLKPATNEQDPYEPEPAAVSQASYEPMTIVTTVQPATSQYAQNSTVSTFSASQYSQYQGSDQHVWGSVGSVAPGLYPYGTVPPSSYAMGHQAMAPHMMTSYSSYTAQMANPYCVPPLLPMPHSYGPPPIPSPLHLSTMTSAYSTPAASQISTESIQTKPVRCLKTIETVKMVPKGKAGPVSALVSIQPIEDSNEKQTSEEAKNIQFATIKDDDIKAKQKKRLEQFNQRMKLKKEQQMEAQRSRGQNRNSAQGKSTPNEIKNVWICGHSLVFWAEKRATSPEYGVQLGMHPDSIRIWWKGVQGMAWQQLVPLLLQLKDNWPKPDVLIFHLGGNDISTTDPEDFIETVKKDLTSLKSIFPGCLLVWSSILSRQTWRGTEDSKEMDVIRMAINESICGIMRQLCGSALSHENIRPSFGLYRPDGVHLSGKGIDTFNLNLQAFLEKWENETNKTEPSV